MIKRRVILKFIPVICLLLAVSGCWNRHELNTLAIVSGIGLDKARGDQILMTVQVFKPGNEKSAPKDQSGIGTQNYTNVTNIGTNALDIIRGFSHEVSRTLYFPQNQVIIFSRDLAEEGLQKHIDFLVRDPDIRLTEWVLISKNKASEVLDVPPVLGNIPANEISRLVESQRETSQSCQVNLEQFITALMSKTTSPILPIIEITGEEPDKKLVIAGTAVFKGDKYAGELNSQETRGLLWVLNEVKGGTIDVVGPDGSEAILEITRSSTKISPEIVDGKIQLKIEVREEGNLGSQSGQEALATPTKFKELEKKQTVAIENEIKAALAKARELDADIFGFGDEIHRKEPGEWKKIAKDWDDTFPYLDIKLKVETKLNFSGKITSPVVIPQKEQ